MNVFIVKYMFQLVLYKKKKKRWTSTIQKEKFWVVSCNCCYQSNKLLQQTVWSIYSTSTTEKQCKGIRFPLLQTSFQKHCTLVLLKLHGTAEPLQILRPHSSKLSQLADPWRATSGLQVGYPYFAAFRLHHPIWFHSIFQTNIESAKMLHYDSYLFCWQAFCKPSNTLAYTDELIFCWILTKNGAHDQRNVVLALR